MAEKDTKKTTTKSAKKPVPKTTKKPTTVKKTTPRTTKPSTTKKPTTKTTSSTTKKPSTAVKKPKVLASEAIVKKQAVSKTLETNEKPQKKRGKSFYLILSIIVFASSFFYINNILYNNNDYIQSAIFAFMIVFVMFVLINFNIHRIFINFFRLPMKYLLEEAKLSIEKEVIVTDKKGIKKSFRKHKAIFTLVFYGIIFLLLVGSQVYAGILDEDRISLIITQSSATGLIFIVIVCSWQYLFNIIPNMLEKSIDAKNGFILTLSAFAMIIYAVFMVFNITYLAAAMLFILIIGFVALLGVNLNMIVGEINIFSNLKNKKNKSVTRIVFMIFFGFHLYIILYASVIGFSIYNWNPQAYNFINTPYEHEIYEDVTDFNFNPVEEVYDFNGDVIDEVYDINGKVITNFIDTNGNVIEDVYTKDGVKIISFYNEIGQQYYEVQTDDIVFYNNDFRYYDGTLVGIRTIEKPHTYGDFLYYTVVTVSTLGYGDITPNTNFATAKAWGAFLGIYGVTFYALSIGFVSNIAIEGAQRKED